MHADSSKPDIRRLLALSLPAVAIGALSAVMLWALDELAHVLQGALWDGLPAALGVDPDAGWWILVVLTATGAAVGLVLWLMPGHGGIDSATTELVAPPLRLFALPSLAIVVVLSLAGGVSLGPENPIIAINTALAVALLARLWPGVPNDLTIMLAAAATIGALFGTPVAAALVFTGMASSIRVAGSLWDKLFLPLVAAGTGSIVAMLLGGGISPLAALEPLGSPTLAHVLWGAVVASGAAAFGLIGAWLLPILHRLLHRLRNPLVYATAGGVMLGLLGMLGGPITLFKGLEQGGELIARADELGAGALAVILVVKLAALIVSAAAGFRGGRVFPAVFIGIAAGMLAHALVPDIPLGLAIACGVLGLVLAIARDGWMALFVAVAVIGDVTLLPVLCLVILPSWLIVTRAPEMIVHVDPATIDQRTLRAPRPDAS